MSPLKTTRVAAIIATILFTALFIFQVLLAAGVPLGKAAYGGKSDLLTPALRIMSLLSALIFLGAIWTVLTRSGVIPVSKGVRGAAGWLVWGLVVLFSLSFLANVMSSSPWERFLMAPSALLIVICCIITTCNSNR